MSKRKKSSKKPPSATQKAASNAPGKAPEKAPGRAQSAQSDPQTPPSASTAKPINISTVDTGDIDVELKTDLPQSKSRISRYISFGLLIGVIALLGILFYEVMAQFLVPLFLAALLVVVFRPFYQWILGKTGGREKTSALLTTAAVLLVVLVPIGTLFVLAAAEGRQVYSQFSAPRIVDSVKEIRTNLKLDMPSKDDLRLIEAELIDLQQNVSLSPTQADRHQISLYEIEEAGKNIALAQGFDWPTKDRVEENEGDEVAGVESDSQYFPKPTSWENFALGISASRTLHDQIPWESSSKLEDKQKRNEALHDYQVKLNETAGYFSDFRTSFLGGKTKAWAIELFNPSDNESEAYATNVVNFLRDKLFRISSATFAYVGRLLLGAAIMIIGLYFFLIDGPKMIEGFKGLSPIDDDHEQELVAEFGRVSRAVVVATLLSALVQGLLAGIGFYFAGLESIFLLTVLSAVLAMVPFVGAAAVWFPCCLYLYFVDNNLAAAIGLGIYGVAVISMADNLIKPFILHGQSNLHPLFALLSVLGGVSALGPIGILIGPMVVAFLQTMLKILQPEMSDLDRLENE